MANVKAKTKEPPRMVKNPFTGKMEKFIPRPVAAPLDMLNPPLKLPPKEREERKAKLDGELTAIRAKYASAEPVIRYGAAGKRMTTKYRKLSLEYQHVTGTMPPKIDADM